MQQIKTRDVLFVLAAGLLLWGTQHPRKLEQLMPRPGAGISPPRFDSTSFDSANFERALHVEVEVGWFTELGERLVWSSMRLGEQLSQGAW